MLDALRADVARVLGADAREIALEPAVSAALVAIASTFDYAKRPRVVIADIDFPADGHTWLALARQGVEVEFVHSPDGIHVPLELFERAVDERTALVCTGHMYYTSGAIQDVKALAAICHRIGSSPRRRCVPVHRGDPLRRARLRRRLPRRRHPEVAHGRPGDGLPLRARRPDRRGSPDGARLVGPIVTLAHPDPAAVVSALRAQGVLGDFRPGIVRLSPHHSTSLVEIDRTLEILAPHRP